MIEEVDKLLLELAELKKALLLSERARRQIERVAEASEQIADQSKRAVLAQNHDLERTVAELREARRVADEANCAKSQFLATMSHEIRTPMNGVLGSLDLLRRTSLDDGQRSLIGMMQTSAEHLLMIIKDILDFSKIESGRMEIELAPFRLAECVESSVAASRHAAARNGVIVTTFLSPELPPIVAGDAHRLRQILLNLVGNAVKFTHKGSIDVFVEPKGASRIAFAVQDTGIGISALALEHIFEAFMQADRGTTRRYGGTGLGLAISKRLAGLMGGDLSVESVVGQGSTFSFEIDLPAAQLAKAPEASACDPAVMPARTMSLLVVDDNQVNLLITRRMLERLGHRVTCVENGREAVEQVMANTFDAVLMDCSMPVMDGYEASRAIRALEGPRSRTPILALTANVLRQDRERCLAAGMDDYVAKPVRLAQLEAALLRAASRGAA